MGPGRRRAGSVVAIAVVLVLGAACAGDSGNDAAATAGSGRETAAAGPTTLTGPTDTTAGMQNGGGGGGRYDYGDDDGVGGDAGGEADVVADNFAFAPAEIEMDAGARILVKNANGSTPHTFTVEGTEVDLELEPLATQDVSLTLDPGTYSFLCRFHPEMTGTLTLV